ncbi:MAG: 50S ribosomal protein L29 [Asgard group archaeon]|nr:50S ribosomal protein L29 [Asgard group archaeon]
MAILRMREIRYMSKSQRISNLKRLQKELSHLRAEIATGGSLEKPSQVKETKRTIARIKTVMREKGEL